MKAFFLVPLLFILVTANDFQATPPMGWSSWNTFFSQIDEEKVMGIADALKRLKLDKLGYVYLTIDDFWNLPQRDNKGQMLVRKEKKISQIYLSVKCPSLVFSNQLSRH